MSIFDLSISSGASFVPATSGASNIGSSGSYFDSGYFNNIIIGSGSLISSGTNFLPASSGNSNIGTPSIPFNQVYANDYWANLPTCAMVASSGVVTAYALPQNTYVIISGNTFSTFSGANFIISGVNPHAIVYTGPNSFPAKIEGMASLYLNGVVTNTLAIFKNSTRLTYCNMNSTTGNPITYSAQTLTNLVSGDQIQLKFSSNLTGVNTTTLDSPFQLVITKAL